MNNFLKYSILCFTLTGVLATQAFASIVISGTRVIYQGNKKEVTVTLTNKNKTPVLIQSWIEQGDIAADKNKNSVPFVITPPINRIDAEKGQTLRIRYLGTPPLPTDKESVFWLNVLEIPAKNKNMADSQNRMSIAFRSRIKLFYRPAGLAGDAMQAPRLLQWKLNTGGANVTNPTPYYVSLTKITYQSNGKRHEVPGIMISPGTTQQYNFKGIESINNLGQLSYSAINDYGALTEYKAKNN